jgi:16S rRNA (guanine(966)-N(2))-methyltransferase RsmD
MRIIAGIAKGMQLAVPRGDDVRPTSDRVREAIFSSLGARVIGARVLDLYAGTGALGLESASRGAASVVLVERARQALEAIGKNLDGFAKQRGEKPVIDVVRGEVLPKLRQLAERGEKFALIFADPPYSTDVTDVLDVVKERALLEAGGLFILETAKRDALVVPSGWRLEREAIYGDTQVRYLALAG